MAEEDDSQKTEDPTDKKLSKARKKGQVAMSPEINSWAILIGVGMGLSLVAPGIVSGIKKTGRTFIEFPHMLSVDSAGLLALFKSILIDVGWILAPLAGILVIAALAAGLGQAGLMMATEKLKPELSKISFKKGMKKIFSSRSVVEFVKGMIKLSIVSVVAFGMALPLLEDITLIPFMSVADTLSRIQAIAIQLTVGTLAVMTVIAIFDYAYQKQQNLKQMRMSKQEIKDEHKQSDGDPQIKARIRKIRNERAQKRMMAAVPEADVVITNPTHYSIALKYDMDAMQAPKVVAKGVDSLAFRIREVAKEHDIPLIENPPLARILYAAVEVDEEIPAEHYAAVAEIIGFIMRRRGDLPGPGASA